MASIKLKGDVSGEVTISAPSVAGTTTLELPATSSTLATQNSLGVRNLIINGDMRIAQRGTSFAPIGSNAYAVDRFFFNNGGGTSHSSTVTQSTDVPSGQGFVNSLKLEVTTADTSVGASDYTNWTQRVESNNLTHLNYGTSNAKTLTATFWVKSNKTGTYTGSFSQNQTSPVRTYPYSFTINTADTWEKKTITVDGDTGGNLPLSNGSGLTWDIAYMPIGTTYQTGSANTWNANTSGTDYSPSGVTPVNIFDTVGNTFYITGVQLEVGTATPFEHRPYDMELARCQRYYLLINGGGVAPGAVRNTTNAYCQISFPVEMRSAPSATLLSAVVVMPGDAGYTVTAIGLYNATTRTTRLVAAIATSSLTSGYAVFLQAGTAITDGISFSSEL